MEYLPTDLPKYVKTASRSQFGDAVVQDGHILLFSQDGKTLTAKNSDGSFTALGGQSVQAGYVKRINDRLYFYEASADPQLQPTGSNIVSNLYTVDTPYGPPQYGAVNEGAMAIYRCASIDTASKTWTGYKANRVGGKYTFEDTVTTGLSFAQGLTPQVGIMYSSDAKIKISQVLQNGIDMPQDGLILYMPFNGTADVKVGTLVSSQGNITFGEEAGQKYGIFDGSTAFSLKTSLGDNTIEPCTLVCYAKGTFSSSQTKTGQICALQTRPQGSSGDYGLEVYINSSNGFIGSNNISCTRNAWNFFCIRRTSRTSYKIQINSNVYTDNWGASYLGAGNFIGYDGADNYYWVGNIFDVALYSRLLTDDQVSALYQRVLPLQA